MPKRFSSLLEIVQKSSDRFGNWNQICQTSAWYLKHMPILVPVLLSVSWASFAWFDFKMPKRVSVTHLVDLILQASKQATKSNKQIKCHLERVFWRWFVSITTKPTCWRKQSLSLPLLTLPTPRISRVFWEFAFVAQSTNVENHKDVLIEKINYSQTVWAISIQTTKQFSLFREDRLVEKIVIKPQNY